MNFVTKVFFFTIVLSACLACNTGESNHSAVATDKVEASTKETNNGPKSKGKTLKDKVTNNSYWDTLVKEVNIDPDKLRAVRSLNEQTNEDVRILRSQKGDNYQEKAKEIRMAEREKVKNILGEALFQKKMDFDKSWTTRNTKDWRKLGTKK